MRPIDADDLDTEIVVCSAINQAYFDGHHQPVMSLLVKTVYEMAREEIRKAPTVDAEPVRHSGWIPCSERLPAKNGHYLCSFKNSNRIDNIFVDLAYWTGGRWYGYLANEINAWMPLPDRYEEEEECSGE